MNFFTILIGIVLFAIVTAILYAWGLRNELRQEQDLERLLLNKSAKKVIKYLKKNGYVTKKEVCELIKNVKSGIFWSKKKARVNNPNKFSLTLIDYMISQQMIQFDGKKGYRLPNKMNQ